MDTAISNSAISTSNPIKIVGGVALGAAIVVAAPILLTYAPSLALWHDVAGYTFGVLWGLLGMLQGPVTIAQLAVDRAATDTCSYVTVALALAYPVHLALRWAIEGFGGNASGVLAFGPRGSRRIAAVSALATVVALVLPMSCDIMFMANASGDSGAMAASSIAMLWSPLIVPASFIVCLCKGFMVLSSEDSDDAGILGAADDLLSAASTHPLLLFVAELLACVIAPLAATFVFIRTLVRIVIRVAPLVLSAILILAQIACAIVRIFFSFLMLFI